MLRVQGVGDRIANSRRKITLAVRVVTHPLASRLLLLIMNERLSGIENCRFGVFTETSMQVGRKKYVCLSGMSRSHW